MKRYVVGTLVLLMILSSTVIFAEELGPDLVLYSTMTENDLNAVVKVFGEKYPQIRIEIVNGSAGELLARIEAEKHNPQGDVVWGGFGYTDGDKHAHLFEHWLSEHEDDLFPAYRSNNGFYSFDHLSTPVFCVNTDLEAELGLNITSYADLLDPALKGKIVFSDPNSSSAAWNNLSNIFAVFGNDSDEAWDLIEGLLRNGMIVSSSSSVAFKSVLDGEYVVGLTYEDGVAPLLKAGATNIKAVYPEEGSSANAFGLGVIKGARNMAEAKAFVNFMMSAEGQSAYGTEVGTVRLTNSKAVYDLRWLPATEDIKWVERDVEWLMANKDNILRRWNDLFITTR